MTSNVTNLTFVPMMLKTYPLKLTIQDHERLKKLAAKAGKPIYKYILDKAFEVEPKTKK